ncbi:MAG: endonuclease/exonuclease/phosphatase family protein [Bacteroidota bacterium]
MKRACIIFCVVFSTSAGLFSQQRDPVKVMTYNIRLDVTKDGENAWPNRKEIFVSTIRYHAPDIVGLQEAQRHQIDYLAQALPDYAWFGIGRDDGKDGGEFMTVFYRKALFDTIRTSTFWCSSTPDHPSLGWDAACNRIVTWGKFKDKRNGQLFYFFNTHLDHMGKIARKESARLLKDSIDAISGKDPAVITGDFNSHPADDPYQTIIATTSRRRFSDTKSISQVPHHGPEGTFNGFKISDYGMEPIDYIFVSEGISVLNHATLTDSFNGRIPSDHFPVAAEIIMNAGR